MLITMETGASGGGDSRIYLIKDGIEKKTGNFIVKAGSATKTQGDGYIDITMPNAVNQNAIYVFDASEYSGKSIAIIADIDEISYNGNNILIGNTQASPTAYNDMDQYFTISTTTDTGYQGRTAKIGSTYSAVGIGAARASFKIKNLFLVVPE